MDNIIRPFELYIMEWMGADWVVKVFWYGGCVALHIASEIEKKTLPRAVSRTRVN